jgi:hypothetical protein
MLLTLAQWVKSTGLSTVLAGSTWAYPVIGGLHVLGIAWFGGAVLFSALRRNGQARGFLWLGGAFMLLTGVLLFVVEPLRCADSRSFLVKVLLLVALAATSRVRSKMGTSLTLAMWAAVLFASQGIAFF